MCQPSQMPGQACRVHSHPELVCRPAKPRAIWETTGPWLFGAPKAEKVHFFNTFGPLLTLPADAMRVQPSKSPWLGPGWPPSTPLFTASRGFPRRCCVLPSQRRPKEMLLSRQRTPGLMRNVSSLSLTPSRATAHAAHRRISFPFSVIRALQGRRHDRQGRCGHARPN